MHIMTTEVHTAPFIVLYAPSSPWHIKKNTWLNLSSDIIYSNLAIFASKTKNFYYHNIAINNVTSMGVGTKEAPGAGTPPVHFDV